MNFFKPKRLVYLKGSPEKTSTYSQYEKYDSLAKKLDNALPETDRLKGNYLNPEANKEIDIIAGGLVKTLMEMYKAQLGENYNEKIAQASAVRITANMAKGAKDLAGFNVDYFMPGDKVTFLENGTVKVAYTPRGEKEKATVTLDLSGSAPENREGVVHETRQALEGTRSDVLNSATASEIVYDVADILGYNWGKPEEKESFLTKVKELGLDDAKIAELAPGFEGSAQRNIAICRFLKGLLDSGEDVFAKMGQLPEVKEQEAAPAPATKISEEIAEQKAEAVEEQPAQAPAEPAQQVQEAPPSDESAPAEDEEEASSAAVEEPAPATPAPQPQAEELANPAPTEPAAQPAEEQPKREFVKAEAAEKEEAAEIADPLEASFQQELTKAKQRLSEKYPDQAYEVEENVNKKGVRSNLVLSFGDKKAEIVFKKPGLLKFKSYDPSDTRGARIEYAGYGRDSLADAFEAAAKDLLGESNVAPKQYVDRGAGLDQEEVPRTKDQGPSAEEEAESTESGAASTEEPAAQPETEPAPADEPTPQPEEEEAPVEEEPAEEPKEEAPAEEEQPAVAIPEGVQITDQGPTQEQVNEILAKDKPAKESAAPNSTIVSTGPQPTTTPTRQFVSAGPAAVPTPAEEPTPAPEPSLDTPTESKEAEPQPEGYPLDVPEYLREAYPIPEKNEDFESQAKRWNSQLTDYVFNALKQPGRWGNSFDSKRPALVGAGLSNGYDTYMTLSYTNEDGNRVQKQWSHKPDPQRIVEFTTRRNEELGGGLRTEQVALWEGLINLHAQIDDDITHGNDPALNIADIPEPAASTPVAEPKLTDEAPAASEPNEDSAPKAKPAPVQEPPTEEVPDFVIEADDLKPGESRTTVTATPITTGDDTKKERKPLFARKQKEESSDTTEPSAKATEMDAALEQEMAQEDAEKTGVYELDTSKFQERVLDSGKLVLVAFYNGESNKGTARQKAAAFSVMHPELSIPLVDASKVNTSLISAHLGHMPETVALSFYKERPTGTPLFGDDADQGKLEEQLSTLQPSESAQ